MYQVFKLKSIKIHIIILLAFCLVVPSVIQHTLFAQKKDTTVSKFKTEFISIENTLTEKEIKLVKRGDFIFSMGPLKYERALEEYFKALESSPDN
jgi:hypothetical protein